MNYSRRAQLFEKLRAEHIGLMTNVLWRLTGERELFAEAMQFAMLALWENVEKLDDPRAAAYIYRIALSANSKAWRNRIGKDGHLPAVQGDASHDIDSESLDVVRRAIAELPQQQAEAVAMRYLSECDYPAIAARLQCSEDTARSHVSKGLAALRIKLTPHNAEE